MNEINWLIVIPGWLGMGLVVISQISYFNRWVGRQEMATMEARKVADNAHEKIDALSEKDAQDKEKLATSLLTFETKVLGDIATVKTDVAEVKTDIRWLVKQNGGKKE